MTRRCHISFFFSKKGGGEVTSCRHPLFSRPPPYPSPTPFPTPPARPPRFTVCRCYVGCGSLGSIWGPLCCCLHFHLCNTLAAASTLFIYLFIYLYYLYKMLKFFEKYFFSRKKILWRKYRDFFSPTFWE